MAADFFDRYFRIRLVFLVQEMEVSFGIKEMGKFGFFFIIVLFQSHNFLPSFFRSPDLSFRESQFPIA